MKIIIMHLLLAATCAWAIPSSPGFALAAGITLLNIFLLIRIAGIEQFLGVLKRERLGFLYGAMKEPAFVALVDEGPVPKLTAVYIVLLGASCVAAWHFRADLMVALGWITAAIVSMNGLHWLRHWESSAAIMRLHCALNDLQHELTGLDQVLEKQRALNESLLTTIDVEEDDEHRARTH